MSNHILDDNPTETERRSPLLKALIILVFFFLAGSITYNMMSSTAPNPNLPAPNPPIDFEEIDSNSLTR